MDDDQQPQGQLYTCLSCSIAFLSPEDQREHYRSDHHRYNMKRRVAGLPPISVAVFNQKVLERRTETAIMSSAHGSACDVCSKTYTTENAYRSHLQSKRHRENELKAAARPPKAAPVADTVESAPEAAQTSDPAAPTTSHAPAPTPAPAPPAASTSTAPTTDAGAEAAADDDDDEMQSIDAKIAAARARIAPNSCLFCGAAFPALADALTHMAGAHSFFIPDAEYLVDVPGLVAYLGEKIAVGNVCIYCGDAGRAFRSLDAVRKHMADKSHCKIAYERESDRLELSDFYDFSASYPDADAVRAKAKTTTKTKKPAAEDADDDEWEEASDVADSDVDEVVDESASDSGATSSEDDEDDLPANELAYGDSPFELVLPSGARIGHRSMRRYYAQSFAPVARGAEDPDSGAALVRRLLADKNSALVPRRGAFGAFGMGTEVVKARNRGEAREAGRHVREFRDMKRREDFRTKVGYIHNSQKHYRDPLLQ